MTSAIVTTSSHDVCENMTIGTADNPLGFLHLSCHRDPRHSIASPRLCRAA
jgi:hypothetical protein